MGKRIGCGHSSVVVPEITIHATATSATGSMIGIAAWTTVFLLPKYSLEPTATITTAMSKLPVLMSVITIVVPYMKPI